MKQKDIGKAVAGNNGLRNTSDYLTDNQKAFSAFNFRKSKPLGQCINCKSDYLRFAVDSCCQDCLQRIEFITRERPQMTEKLFPQGGRHK